MATMPLGEWTRRLGALLAEAYDCFMVGTHMGSTEYKRGSRAIARGQWQAPLGSSRGKPRSRAVCRRARPSLRATAMAICGRAEECSRRGIAVETVIAHRPPH